MLKLLNSYNILLFQILPVYIIPKVHLPNIIYTVNGLNPGVLVVC